MGKEELIKQIIAIVEDATSINCNTKMDCSKYDTCSQCAKDRVTKLLNEALQK